jgi:transposase
METVPVFVGLDYHASVIQVCVMDAAGTQLCNTRCANSAEAIGRVVERHGVPREVAIEACCGSANLAEELTDRYGWSVALAHAGYVRRMKGSPDKSDAADSQILADLTRVGYLPRVWTPPEQVRSIRRLVRHRQTLVNQRRADKLRLRAALRDERITEPFKAWTIRWMAWIRITSDLSDQTRWVVSDLLANMDHITGRIRAVEQRLRKLTRLDAVVKRLLQQRGVGPITAWTLRAEIGRFNRFRTGKQMCRFCGLSPRNASSGQREADAGLVKAGNPTLRAVLIEAAHRLRRLDPRWRAMSERMREARRPGSVIAAAVANRWMRTLFHAMKEEGAHMA